MKRISGYIALIAALMSFQNLPKKTGPSRSGKSTVSITASIEIGKIIYLQKCLSCHQVDGGGVPHLNAPLDGASAVVGNDKAKIIRIVLNGMTDRVEIDGEYYSNNMAPHKDLTNRQIADVLTYVRNSWTNKASAVTAAEVKAVRAKNK